MFRYPNCTVGAMSLYSQYIKERESGEVLEWEHSFATYFIIKEECYIRDIYVQPLYRNDHLGSRMANEITKIAKSKGCKYLTGSVDPKANKSEESKKVLIAYGMREISKRNGLIYFGKEIL